MLSSEDIVITIDKPHFVVKLGSTVLKLDLKDGMKRDIERLAEARPGLRDTIGLLFQTVVPLDVPLKNIKSVGLDKEGRVKVAIPHRKDLVIPLDETESKRLVDKLNELIPVEKERALKDLSESKKVKEEYATKGGIARKEGARGTERYT